MNFILHFYGRIKTISSFTDFSSRLKNLFVLAYKIITGRYGKKYWKQERQKKINLYLQNPDNIKELSILIDVFNIYYNLRKYEDCKSVYNRILSLKLQEIPTEIYISMSESFFFLKEYQKSVESVLDIKQTNCKNYNLALTYLFLSYTKLKDISNAEKIYKKLSDFYTLQEIEHITSGILADIFFIDKLYVTSKKQSIESKKYISLSNAVHDAGADNCLDKTDIAVEKLNLLNETDFLHDKMLHNLFNNEHEIARREKILLSFPRSLNVTLTNNCNLKCIMCFANEEKFEVSKNILEEIKNIIPYLQNISWMGGEVFLYKDFIELLQWTAQYSVRQEIITNGLLLDEKTIKILLTNHIDITISVDGTSKDVYENVRLNGNFSKLLEILSQINKIRKELNSTSRLKLNTVIIKNNYHQIPDFLEFANKYGFDIISFNSLVRDSRTKELDIFGKHFDKNIVAEITKNINYIRKNALIYGIQIENSLPTESFIQNIATKEYVFNCSMTSAQTLSCHIPWKRLFIASNGDVYPNCFCKVPVGNLINNSLTSVWNSKKMLEYRTNILNNSRKKICSDDCLGGRIPENSLKHI